MGRAKEKKERGKKTKGKVKGGDEGGKGEERKKEWGKENEIREKREGRDGTPLSGTKCRQCECQPVIHIREE